MYGRGPSPSVMMAEMIACIVKNPNERGSRSLSMTLYFSCSAVLQCTLHADDSMFPILYQKPQGQNLHCHAT